MIDAREIERRADRLGLLPVQVEKDYLLNHVLGAIEVVALEEILANKVYMLDDRKESRDL